MNLNTISDYFINVLDIPSYYVYIERNSFNSKFLYDYELYAVFGDIKLFIVSPEFRLFGLNSPVSSRIVFFDGENSISLILIIDDYTLLIINDIIKTLGGEIL